MRSPKNALFLMLAKSSKPTRKTPKQTENKWRQKKNHIKKYTDKCCLSGH